MLMGLKVEANSFEVFCFGEERKCSDGWKISIKLRMDEPAMNGFGL